MTTLRQRIQQYQPPKAPPAEESLERIGHSAEAIETKLEMGQEDLDSRLRHEFKNLQSWIEPTSSDLDVTCNTLGEMNVALHGISTKLDKIVELLSQKPQSKS